MKRSAWSLVFLLGGCTSAQINQTISEVNKTLSGDSPLTTSEVGAGLKEALIKKKQR